MTYPEIQALSTEITSQSYFIERIKTETAKVIVGQENIIEKLLIGLLSEGHILLEGMPGLAKTLAIKTLAQTVSASYSRIQFTPDLLPADITGTLIYSPRGVFEVKKGPIFANFILADEINRAPAKVQSALLEAMQEMQVTIGDTTHKLDSPFLVLATQNPVEQEGTYPLPEAQLDRFMLKVKITYPNMDEERQIIRRQFNSDETKVNVVAHTSDILQARTLIQRIYIDPKIEQYILDLVFATRKQLKGCSIKNESYIRYGASPRASIALAKAAKSLAFMCGRGYVIPEDVRSVSAEVLRHRIGLTFEAESDNVSTDDIIYQILDRVVVP